MGVATTTQQSVPPEQGQPLNGRHIVVTRPAEQAVHLAAEIGRAGGTAVLFPVLAICACSDPQRLDAIAARLDEFDLAVFVSPNAVKHALARILPGHPWPSRLRTATVGKASESELARFGISQVIAPQNRFDSEALLEMAEMQEMAGLHVVVFRGDGGRELLGETLTGRGATVEYVACYRREKPQLDATPLLRLSASHQLDGIIVTSSEGLRNLCEMFGLSGRQALTDTPLFLPHARIAEQARKLDLRRVVLTAPGDEGILSGLIEFFSSPEHERNTATILPGPS